MPAQGPPENRPPDTAIDTIYTPLDPLGNDDLPPDPLPDGDAQPAEQSTPDGQAADDCDNAPAYDADVSPEETPEDDLPEPDSGTLPGDPAPF